jgi:uncharacterized membrane protein YedE/YeeE
MIEQDWLYGFLGGVLIGLAASMFLLINGRTMGASGIIGGLVDKSGWHNYLERISFIAGLIFIPAVISFTYNFPKTNITSNIYLIIIAGLLVGIGTTLAQGCTSGHGICGISRISVRSIVATIFYIISGAAIVFALNNFMEIL